MKKIGIVGGLGPESTVLYYQLIMRRFAERYGTEEMPLVVIDSVNIKKLVRLINANAEEELVEYLAQSTRSLAAAGADFAVMATNTPHFVYTKVAEKSPIPMISIVESTAAFAAEKGYKKLGLTGTGFTMKKSFYPEVFSRYGMELVVPEPHEIEEMHRIIFAELAFGVVSAYAMNYFATVQRNLVARHAIDALILGCTELPLVYTPENSIVPLVDTAAIHVEAVLDTMAQ